MTDSPMTSDDVATLVTAEATYVRQDLMRKAATLIISSGLLAVGILGVSYVVARPGDPSASLGAAFSWWNVYIRDSVFLQPSVLPILALVLSVGTFRRRTSPRSADDRAGASGEQSFLDDVVFFSAIAVVVLAWLAGIAVLGRRAGVVDASILLLIAVIGSGTGAVVAQRSAVSAEGLSKLDAERAELMKRRAELVPARRRGPAWADRLPLLPDHFALVALVFATVPVAVAGVWGLTVVCAVTSFVVQSLLGAARRDRPRPPARLRGIERAFLMLVVSAVLSWQCTLLLLVHLYDQSGWLLAVSLVCTTVGLWVFPLAIDRCEPRRAKRLRREALDRQLWRLDARRRDVQRRVALAGIP